jgi:predicted nuclease of restriction endonuclease-like (RecB) superfamily
MSVKQKDQGMSADTAGELNFTGLVDAIRTVHEQLSRHAAKAVNISLTVQNWLIGFYIREYEQHGSDRAKYGEGLLERLAERLQHLGIERANARELRRYRLFYVRYPQVRESVSPEFQKTLPGPVPTSREIRGTASPELSVAGKRLLSCLSFSHFDELLEIDDPLKRVFYEVECIKGNWSVRELKRQIASLYFERCGLSKNKKALSRLTQTKAEADSPQLVIRDPYVFEFLGMKPKEVMHESNLEDALLGKVQDFLLELGRGFCFEARQKRILIGSEYFFVDLVFYHRILRCHVLFELKADSFKHEHLGQLNSYVGWYKEHEMMEGDNPPVGILLCTAKNHALVKYALAGMDNRLFVSQYQVKLPSVDELRAFVERELKKDA